MKAKPSKKELRLLAQSLIGAQMSNFLFNLYYRTELPMSVREEAKKLQERWDEVAPFQLNNPIVSCELEAFIGEKGKRQ